MAKLELKLKDGNFELWAQGNSRAFVMVATGGDVNQPHRTAVEIFSAAGTKATDTAHRVYNNMVLAYTQATR